MIRGRHRKQGPREPNGRPQRESVGEIMGVVFSQPHRRWLAGRPKLRNKGDARGDQMAETQVGALCLAGLIGEPLYQAAVDYRRTVSWMKWSISCPPGEPAAMRLLRSYGEARDPTPDEAARARVSYDDARYAVMATSVEVGGRWHRGHYIMRAVDDVVIRNMACEDIGLLKAGLSRLANHFGYLTRRTKSVESQK